MSVSNIELIKHIFDECAFITTHTNGKDSNQVINDKVLVRALERSIEIIGEAANKVDDEFKKDYPHIEWRKWRLLGINLFTIISELIMIFFGTSLKIKSPICIFL